MSKDSSAIENIVTTTDALFRQANLVDEAGDPVAREALRDYLSHRQFALQERHQTKDIAAALAEAKLQQPQESGKLVMEDGFAVLVAPPGAPEMTPELVKALRDDLP